MPARRASQAAAACGEWMLVRDSRTLAAGLLMQVAVLSRGLLTDRERKLVALLAALTLGALLFLRLCRRQYTALRLPIVSLVRLVFMAPPVALDVLRIMQPARGGGGDVDARSTLRAVMVLLLPLAWVDGSMVAGVGLPLPPAVHAVLHTACIAALMRRAPAACMQYVAQHPSNARVARAAYGALQQLASLLCVGTRMHLAAAAEAASDAEQCVAVVWGLEASLALVLPTLLVWQAQLREEQRRQQQAAAAEAPVETGDWQHRLLCRPLLDAAGAFGWPVFVVGTGLAGFLAGVVWHAAGMDAGIGSGGMQAAASP